MNVERVAIAKNSNHRLVPHNYSSSPVNDVNERTENEERIHLRRKMKRQKKKPGEKKKKKINKKGKYKEID